MYCNSDSVNNSFLVNVTQDAHAGVGECAAYWLVVYGVILLAVCVVGLIGNSLSLVVLCKDKGNKVAGLLLKALALADNLNLLLALLCIVLIMGILPSVQGMGRWTQNVKPYLSKYVNPLAAMLQTIIAWMTVLLAINRYVAVCHPFHSLWLFTTKKAWAMVLGVFCVSVIYNAPRFFQVDILVQDNETCQVETSIGDSSMFGVVFTHWMYTVIVLLIPILLLLVLNVLVIRELRARRYNSIRASTSGGNSSSSNSSEDSITVTMLAIVLVFLVCNTPDRMTLLLDLAARDVVTQSAVLGPPCYYVHVICNTLVATNSASNFFIYYIFRPGFRKTLGKLLCRRCATRHRSNWSTGKENNTVLTSM